MSRPRRSGSAVYWNHITKQNVFSSIQLGFNVQAVIAHTCHGHTLQLSAGLSVYDSTLVVVTC